MKEFKIHPYADLMPYASELEIESLAEDIRINGLMNPIVLFKKGKDEFIIDGRHRQKSCLLAGVEPKYVYYDGTEDSLLQYVLSTNILRRHLSVGQKACLACEIVPMLEEQTEASRKEKISKSRSTGESVGIGETSRDAAGKLFGVSGKYVGQAKKLKQENNDLFIRVKSGEISLNKAMTEMKAGAGKSETVESFPSSGDENVEVVSETMESLPSSKVDLSKLEVKKVSELVALGLPENKSVEYIISKRKVKSATVKPKSSYAGRVEIKMPEEQKQLLVDAAKSNNMSLSEYIRTLINKG